MVILFIVVSSVCTLTKLKELLDAHAIDCCHAQKTKFTDDPRCRFTNIQQLSAPFVVYADFESILKPVDKDADTTQGVEIVGESSSHVFQEHIPCGFAYKVVSSVDPNLSRPLVMYRGENAAEKFVRDLQQETTQTDKSPWVNNTRYKQYYIGGELTIYENIILFLYCIAFSLFSFFFCCSYDFIAHMILTCIYK